MYILFHTCIRVSNRKAYEAYAVVNDGCRKCVIYDKTKEEKDMNEIKEKPDSEVYQLNFANMGLPLEEAVSNRTTAKKLTPAQAIAEYCGRCSRDSSTPAACIDPGCPLWQHRPGRKKRRRINQYTGGLHRQ